MNENIELRIIRSLLNMTMSVEDRYFQLGFHKKQKIVIKYFILSCQNLVKKFLNAGKKIRRVKQKSISVS